MRVLEAIATLGPGGAESLVCDLSTALVRHGVEVGVLLIAGIRGERGELQRRLLEDLGITIVGRKERKAASFSNLLLIRSALQEWNPDIVHCHLYNTEVAFVLAKLLFGGASTKYARTIHNTNIVGTRSKAISHFLVHHFDLNVACSATVEKAYKEFVRCEQSNHKICTIQNGCVLAEYNTTDEEKRDARQRLSLPNDSFVFCVVGAFRGKRLTTSQKAQDIALKGFASAFKNDTRTLLVFAGDGPLRSEAESIARECGIKDQVRFLGNIPESWPLLKASDVFLMPSRHEGLPIALLEAASTGLPVIASDIPEIRIVQRRNDGWQLCAVDDPEAFSRTMQNVKKQYTKSLHAARDWSDYTRERYSIDTCAKEYQARFEALLH